MQVLFRDVIPGAEVRQARGSNPNGGIKQVIAVSIWSSEP